MQKKGNQKIVIIGCGNLAWHLAEHLCSQKKATLTVYNHRPSKKLDAFMKTFRCSVFSGLDKIQQDADIYFICVSDTFISTVSKKIRPLKPDAIVLHTSGSKSIATLAGHLKNKAVFYPLQTFSKEAEVNWAQTPLLIEGNNANSTKQVKQIAQWFSKKVVPLNSAERLKIHLAAVLVNNFTNALYVSADNFIKETVKSKAAGFNLLLPLIEQTTGKLKALAPVEAQTGPAKRNDKKVIKQHLKILKGNRALRKLYKQFSGIITTQQKANNN